MIPFNKASISEIERKYIQDALENKLCGDGIFTEKARELLQEKLGITNLLLTTSCSIALDMSAMILDIKEGDEIILPSYTFVSTANAFLLRGAKLVFCDIDDNFNIDVDKIEMLITNKTKVIVPVHYAGCVCDMDKVCALAKKYNLYVVEDAAQAVGTFYKGRPAGTLGDIGCFSFHDTKNYTMGEGGAIIVKNNDLFKKAEIIREKGTDRSQFLRGQVDKYTWRDMGSSYLPSELLAALLCGQIERFDEIMGKRLNVWQRYHDGLVGLEREDKLIIQKIPENSTNNAHMFYFTVKNSEVRTALLSYLKDKGIGAVYHYIPLHNSPMGKKLNSVNFLEKTEDLAGRIIRLPLFADLGEKEVEYIISEIKNFWKDEK